MKKVIILTLAVLSIVGLYTSAQTRNGMVLTDTQAAIDFMYGNGLTKFNTTSTFMANSNLRRDEAAAFFARLARDVLGMIPDTSKTECSAFTDLSQGHSDLQGEMIASCQLGLFKGYNGKFTPTASFTNAQALTVIVRLLDGDQPETGAHWANNYLARAKVLGLTSGLSADSSNNLDSYINRGEVARLIEAGNNHRNGGNDTQANTIDGYFSNYHDPIDTLFKRALLDQKLGFITIPDHIQSQVNGPHGAIDIDGGYRFTIDETNEVCKILEVFNRLALPCYDKDNGSSIYIEFKDQGNGSAKLVIMHNQGMIETKLIEKKYQYSENITTGSSISYCGITILNPSPNTANSFPLTIEGVIDNNNSSTLGCSRQMFEGQAGTTQLYFWDGGNNEWHPINTPFIIHVSQRMTLGPVPFTITIDFNNNGAGLPSGTPMKVTFTEENPSGEGTVDTLDFPLTLQ